MKLELPLTDAEYMFATITNNSLSTKGLPIKISRVRKMEKTVVAIVLPLEPRFKQTMERKISKTLKSVIWFSPRMRITLMENWLK
ncbi:hypothetical protein PAAL66ix_02611 [Paenibacillus alvei A6-6i-x]|nr:hypothetical protein PAAL66ix_02611 [Paenibacillus alvei A6-6i-x]